MSRESSFESPTPAPSPPDSGLPPPRVLIVGCGNPLRGDDAAGPVAIQRLWRAGLPDGVRCADGGTGGMDVAFQMRGVDHVGLIDACATGAEPGSLFEVPGSEVEQLPPLAGINLHAFRWDHALAFARWLLKEDYPRQVTVYLIEAERLDFSEALSDTVDRAVDRLVTRLLDRFGTTDHDHQSSPSSSVSSP